MFVQFVGGQSRRFGMPILRSRQSSVLVQYYLSLLNLIYITKYSVQSTISGLLRGKSNKRQCGSTRLLLRFKVYSDVELATFIKNGAVHKQKVIITLACHERVHVAFTT